VSNVKYNIAAYCLLIPTFLHMSSTKQTILPHLNPLFPCAMQCAYTGEDNLNHQQQKYTLL